MINHIPDQGSLDKEALTRRRNSDSPISVEVTVELGPFQHLGPLGTIIRLGRESRRRLDEVLPGHLPETQRRLIAIIQDRVRFRTMRHHDKGGFEQCSGLLVPVASPLDQLFSGPMTIAVQ